MQQNRLSCREVELSGQGESVLEGAVITDCEGMSASSRYGTKGASDARNAISN